MDQIVKDSIGVLLAAAGVVFAHWQWERTAGRITLEMCLIRDDGLPYVGRQRGEAVPCWKVTARNLGRVATDVSRITLITTDRKRFSAAEYAEGPALPATLLPGHGAEWVFRSNLTHDLGCPIRPVPGLRLGHEAYFEKMSKRSTGRVVHAKAEFGAGKVIIAQKRLWVLNGVYRALPLTRREVKLELASLEFEDQTRALGLSEDEG